MEIDSTENELQQSLIIDSKTLEDLKVIWNDIGYTDIEKESAISKLYKSTEEFLRNRVISETQARDRMQTSIVQSVDSIIKMSSSMKENVPPELSTTDTNDRPLVPILAEVMDIYNSVKDRWDERMNCIVESHNSLHSIWDTLGYEPSARVDFAEINKDDVSFERMKEYSLQLSNAMEEVSVRKNLVMNLVKKIHTCWNDLGLCADESDFGRAIENNDYEAIGVSQNNIDNLSELIKELEKSKKECEETIKGLATEITTLWQRLKVPEKTREEFFKTHVGLGPDVIDACKNELLRLRILKQQNISRLVREARLVIDDLWEKLYYTAQQKQEKQDLVESSPSEAVLEAQEKEIERLEKIYDTMAPLMRAIDRREEILQEEKEFEAVANDPNRLLTKKRDPGRLLREEKFRTIMTKELPRLEDRIQKRLIRYKKESGSHFLYFGTPYLERIKNQTEERKQRKEEEKRRRKQRLADTAALKEKKTNIKAIKPLHKPGTIRNKTVKSKIGVTPLLGKNTLKRGYRTLKGDSNEAVKMNRQKAKRVYGTVNDVLN